MRRRLSTTLGSGGRCSSEPRGPRCDAGLDHGTSFSGPQKEKPGGGNAGSDLFVIGVYGFKYAAWLFARDARKRGADVVIVQPISFLVLLLSCSSLTFRNLTEAFAVSHRFLFVCALTRPWVRTNPIKQDTCHRAKNYKNQRDIEFEPPLALRLGPRL